MQIIGRPFDEATVLRVGHAYQQATDWHTRHPQLDPARRNRKSIPKATSRWPPISTRKRATSFCAPPSAPDCKLNDVQTTILLETAPFALAMAERIRKPRARMEEPSLVFRFPG